MGSLKVIVLENLVFAAVSFVSRKTISPCVVIFPTEVTELNSVFCPNVPSSSSIPSSFAKVNSSSFVPLTLFAFSTIILDFFSTLSNFAAVELESGIQDEIGDDLLLEAGAQENIPFNIKLEDDENVEGIIILNGTDTSSTNANDKIQLEEFFNEVPTDYKILLEEHNVFAAEGQIPEANYTLNSTNVITKGNVRSADISVRDTGDITLEDATDDTHGFLVLNSTSGSSTNAGENIDLEGATGISY